jgi:hypothetical protein
MASLPIIGYVELDCIVLQRLSGIAAVWFVLYYKDIGKEDRSSLHSLTTHSLLLTPHLALSARQVRGNRKQARSLARLPGGGRAAAGFPVMMFITGTSMIASPFLIQRLHGYTQVKLRKSLAAALQPVVKQDPWVPPALSLRGARNLSRLVFFLSLFSGWAGCRNQPRAMCEDECSFIATCCQALSLPLSRLVNSSASDLPGHRQGWPSGTRKSPVPLCDPLPLLPRALHWRRCCACERL